MVEKSGYKIEDFGELKEVDKFISQNTKFSSWEELIGEAAGKWGIKQILKWIFSKNEIEGFKRIFSWIPTNYKIKKIGGRKWKK